MDDAEGLEEGVDDDRDGTPDNAEESLAHAARIVRATGALDGATVPASVTASVSSA